MGIITKRGNRFKVSVRRKGYRAIYETFDKISDARSLSYKIFKTFLPSTKLWPRSCLNKNILSSYIRGQCEFISIFLYFWFGSS